MEAYYVDTPKTEIEKAYAGKTPSIFLAGPTPREDGVDSWRPEALELLNKHGFTGGVFIPEDRGAERYADYDGQINWEWDGLDAANVIIFWVPRELTKMPAFTTNVEFGLYAASGKCVLGYPEGTPKNRYLHAVAEKYGMPVVHTLEDTIKEALKLLK